MATNKELNKIIYEFYKYNNIYRINERIYHKLSRQYYKEEWEYDIGIVNNHQDLLEIKTMYNNQEEKLRNIYNKLKLYKYNILKVIDKKIYIEDITPLNI
tara:strand:+ start:89 stop:388 length:300 start_codon:yes stop_codon:yes gene_type:complete